MAGNLKIGFVPTCMAEFDAVLDVADVRAGEIPNVSKPDYLSPMQEWLSTFGEVICTPVAGDEQSAMVANRLLCTAKIDVLVVHEFAFTLATTFKAVVEGLNVPIVFWNTQMIPAMHRGMGFGTAMANNSVSSIPHSTNWLFQAGIDCKVITGTQDNARTQKRFAQLFAAVGAKKKLTCSRIASIGYVYPGMTTIQVNETSFIQTFGVRIDHVNPVEVKQCFLRADATRVARHVEKLTAAGVQALNIEEVERAAKYCVAFEDLVERKQADAVALLCGLLILEQDMGVAPCYALTQLANRGIHTACECDIPSATALMIAQQIAGNAHFTEFYMMDMQEELVMMCHCGYGNSALANEKYPVKIARQPCFPGPCGAGAAVEYTAKAGAVTLLSITASPCGYKLVAANMECVDVQPYEMGCPQIVARFANVSLDEGVEAYCRAGGSHHMVICYGDITEELALLSELLDIEYEVI